MQSESTLSKASPVKDNSDLKNILNHVLDRQIMELDTRFKADTYGFMRAAAALLPLSCTFGDNELIQPASTHFSICVEDAEPKVFVQCSTHVPLIFSLSSMALFLCLYPEHTMKHFEHRKCY